MDFQIQKLIDNGTIICGKIIEENGIIRFERIEPSQIENIQKMKEGLQQHLWEEPFLLLIKMVAYIILKG